MRRGDPAATLYRALLRIYPIAFREHWGAEMETVFRAERRARASDSAARRTIHVMGAFADVLRGGAAERLRAAFQRMPGTAARRQTRRGSVMDDLARDFKQALRAFGRNPSFAFIAVLTIALGIGANTAIFSVVRAVLLRPLPYAEPEQLVFVVGALENRNVQYWPTSPPDLLEYQAQVTRLSQLEAVFTFAQPMISEGAEPEQVEMAGVTPGFLSMLGLRPVVGRLFVADDAIPPPPGTPPGAGPPVMLILSHELWQTRFGANPDVVGRTVTLGGDATIIGVLEPGVALHMPAAAGLSSNVDAWIAPRIDAVTANRNNVFLHMVGRLAPGATIEQVQQQINGVVRQIRAENERAESAGLRQTVVRLHDDVTREVRPIVLALLGAVGFVLLIACANVSNLLLVRASTREREMAVRAALGGSRAGIARQVLVESLTLAFAGAAFGLLLAAGGIRLLLALQPPDLPRLSTVSIDGVVLGYTVLAAVLAAAIFGMMPAVQSSRADVARVLKDRGASAGSRVQGRIRSGVVVLEVALSLVLLIGAGLMVRSFMALRDVEPGYDADRVLTFGVQLPFQRYQTPEQRFAFITQFRERLAALPGAAGAGATTIIPLNGVVANGPYGTEDVLADPERMQQAQVRLVTEGYFTAMGTRVLDGRVFTDADRTEQLLYVVIDETLARRTWPGERAVGKRMMVRLNTPDYVPVEVLGVVEHQRSSSLAAEGRETIFYHDAAAAGPGNLTWVVRTDGDPAQLIAGARSVLAEMDPLIPMTVVRTMRDYVNAAMAPTRFALVLIAVFGATALILAAVGLYGVLAFAVRQRTAEIGIRMAFGAGGRTILRMVVSQGLRLAAVGIVIGVFGAFALTRVIASQLVGVAPTDPATFASVAVAFLAIAAIACALPALRATRVDPLVALREE